MSGSDRVVFAFAAVGESGQSAGLTKCTELFVSAGEQLVGIRLMADVVNNGVLRQIEHSVDGESDFHHAQIRCQVTAVFGNRVDDHPADFPGKGGQTAFTHTPHILRRMDFRQNFEIFFHYNIAVSLLRLLSQDW